MALPVFPTYAKILLNGFSQQRESALMRTEMDSGPPKQAKIKSRVMITRSVQIMLASVADFYKFEAWYANDVNEGASWFQFTDPISDKVITARFVDGGYSATPMSGGNGPWTVSTKLEAWGQ